MHEGQPERSYRCLVSGDSISRGIVYDESRARYLPCEEGYVRLVGERLRAPVSNVSRFGTTLLRGLERLERDIEREAPDIVLLEYGGNDCDFDWRAIAASPEAEHRPRTELPLFERALADCLAGLKARAIVPVLMTLPPLEPDRFLEWVSGRDEGAARRILRWLGSVAKIYWWQERYSAAILAVAERTRTRWIDARGAFLRRPDFSALLCRDGIHPNREGQRLIAEAVVEYVAENSAFLLA